MARRRNPAGESVLLLGALAAAAVGGWLYLKRRAEEIVSGGPPGIDIGPPTVGPIEPRPCEPGFVRNAAGECVRDIGPVPITFS